MSDPHNPVYASVWDAICDSAGEAANLRLRSDLMNAIRSRIDQHGWTRGAAAEQLGVDTALLDALYRGKLSEFSTDVLVHLAGTVGVHVVVEADH